MKTFLHCIALCFGILLCGTQTIHAAGNDSSPCSITGYDAKKCAATATAMSHGLSTYGQKQMYVAYLNLFRYQFNPQINSTTIAAATVPGALAPPVPTGTFSLGGAAQPQAQTVAAGAPPALNSNKINQEPLVADQCTATALYAGTSDAQKNDAVNNCFIQLQTAAINGITEVAGIRSGINQNIRAVADEQHCYLVRMRDFAQPVLTKVQAEALVQFAKDNQAQKDPSTPTLTCVIKLNPEWKSEDADTEWNALLKIQAQLSSIKTAPGFSGWAQLPGDQATYDSTVASLTSLITEVSSYATRVAPSGGNANIGQTFTDFQNAVDSNQTYRDSLRAIAIAAAAAKAADQKADTANVLVMTIPLNPCAEWYGRGRTDTVSLQYTDITVTPPGSPASYALGTNTCMPMSIASSGIGVTFLPNPVFGFVPLDNTGAQVIGETAVNDKAPLYAALYNVKLLPINSSMELFASPGVGFTSSSNTTTTDILAGLSLSLARRLLFITPSADIGRRDELSPGFTLNTPKGSLTSVPTRPHWSANFMISVTFGIGAP